MDVISHGLVGVAAALPLAESSKELWGVFIFSMLPDLFQIPLYLFIGSKQKRFLWIPHHIDWSGWRKRHYIWFALWELPNSVLFFIFIIMPLIYIFGLPWTYAVGYLAHIVADIFTHTGEWSVQPFFPFTFQIEGYFDVWKWPANHWILSWIGLCWIILFLIFIF